MLGPTHHMRIRPRIRCRIRAARFAALFAALLVAPQARAQEEVVLEVWGLVEARGLHGTFEAARVFDERHPGIRVEIGTPGGQGDLDPQKLLTAMAAETPPDVVWLSRHALAMWVTSGSFRSLDDLIERDGVDMGAYYRGTELGSKWRGSYYALPWGVDCRVLFANMDILHEAGYDGPPETWDEIYAMTEAITEYDDRLGRYEVLGFAPNYGNAWLYLYGWQNGAQWLSDDGTEARLTSPEVVEALDWMVQSYDLVGGAERVQAFQGSAQFESVGDPFLAGRIAMQINGNFTLDLIARSRPDMNFEVFPPPMPEAGMQPISWSGGFGWMIPEDADEVEAAWEFMKWMNSEEAWRIQSEAQKAYGEMLSGEDALFVPFFSAHREINETLVTEYMDDLPPRFQRAQQVCLDLLPNCKHPPVSPAASELWDAQDKAAQDAIFHILPVEEALRRQERRVQSALDRHYEPPQGPEISMSSLAWTVAAIELTGLLVFGYWWIRRVRTYSGLRRSRALAGISFITPWAVGFLTLVFGPMLLSLIMAFTRYDVLHPPIFIGVENWERMLGFHDVDGAWTPNDPQFWKGLWNTFYIVALGVPATMAISLAIALLLNAKVRGISVYRTLFYVPVMVPHVVAAMIWLWLLNPETGIVNYLVNSLLGPMGVTAPVWFGQPEWAKPGLIMLLIWGCGGTVIIWLAGLQTLPGQVYEAAKIDGAGPWRRFFHITVPLLTPYILFLWIMGTIASLQIFTQAYIITAPGDSLLFYALYLFFRAFRYFEMGYASAMAWVLFVITVAVCLWQLRLSKKWVHYEGQ